MARINPYKKFNGIHIPEGITKVPISQLSHGAKMCYGRLARYAGKNGVCFPGIKTLAREIGVCRRAVDDYLKELKDFGLIESSRRGLGKSNLYYFLDNDVLRDALTCELENADTQVVDTHNTTDKESHSKESNIKESQIVSNPSGLIRELTPIEVSELGDRNKIDENIKEIIMAYRLKVSKSYPPQITSETTSLIKMALKEFTIEQILEGIDRYSKHTWWMEHTAQHGINWYFKYSYSLNEFVYLNDFLYLEEKIW